MSAQWGRQLLNIWQGFTLSAPLPVTIGALGTTATDASLSITSGGTAQALLAAATRAEVGISNPDASEDLWFAPCGVTAVVGGQGSYKIPAGQTAILQGPLASTAISTIAATTAHKVSAYKVV